MMKSAGSFADRMGRLSRMPIGWRDNSELIRIRISELSELIQAADAMRPEYEALRFALEQTEKLRERFTPSLQSPANHQADPSKGSQGQTK
jgi:hypothetical protein